MLFKLKNLAIVALVLTIGCDDAKPPGKSRGNGDANPREEEPPEECKGDECKGTPVPEIKAASCELKVSAPQLAIGRSFQLSLVTSGDVLSAAIESQPVNAGGGSINMVYDGRTKFEAVIYDIKLKPHKCEIDVISLGNPAIQKRTLAAGFGQTCLIDDEGALWCWGYNANYRAGMPAPATDKVLKPMIVPGFESGVSDVSAAGGQVCALKNQELYCWGYGLNGRLGDGKSTTTGGVLPTKVLNLAADVKIFAVGFENGCAVRDNKVFCWGISTQGALGIGHLDSRFSPVEPVLGLEGPGEITAIAAGKNSACVIKNGDVYCWGKNNNKQLGQDPYKTGPDTWVDHISGAVKVLGLEGKASRIAMGDETVCVSDNRKLKCWGVHKDAGTIGLMGIGPTSLASLNFHRPQELPILDKKPVVIDLGDNNQACALFDDDGVYCWGKNQFGEIGRETKVAIETVPTMPVLSDPNISEIATGRDHTCVKYRDDEAKGRKVKCFGNNTLGELGIGAVGSAFNGVPVDVNFN